MLECCGLHASLNDGWESAHHNEAGLADDHYELATNRNTTALD